MLLPPWVEWSFLQALESITTNKASGGDGIPVELFQILKDDVVKVLHSICQQVWKSQQWPQAWKRSVFIPIPRKAMPKNAQATTQLHSSHMLVSESEVAQSCPTLCDPMDCSLPGSSVHGIFQAIVLEWIAISFSRGSSQPRDRTRVSRIVDRRLHSSHMLVK